MSATLPYTGVLVRQHDPDRFFLTLMQPAAQRPGLWALLAFNHEIARTSEVVSEPTLGYMRLQWWRDALNNIYAGNKPPKHEILEPLAEAIHQYSLPQDLFEGLLTARERDLDDHVPNTVADLKIYAASTTLPLTRLMLAVTGDRVDGVESIACAYGLCGLMRAIPFQAQQGRCMVPSASIEDLFRDAGKRKAALTGLHDAAAQELIAAGRTSSKLLRHMQHATRLYLRHMRGLDYDLLDRHYSEMPPFFHLRLLFNV